jgi:hypothetical protein
MQTIFKISLKNPIESSQKNYGVQSLNKSNVER